MASANSPSLNYSAPAPSATEGNSWWRTTGPVSLLLLALAGLPYLTATMKFHALVSALCLAWLTHLDSRSLPWVWSCSAALLLGAQLLIVSLPDVESNWENGFGGLPAGVLTYLMFWTFSVRYRRGLQALATLAFLLALTLFGGPSILVTGVFLSLVFVAGSRRRFGGYAESAFLIFTPAALCFLFTVLLRVLAVVVIHLPVLNLNLLEILHWRFVPLHGLWLRPLLPPLVVGLGTVCCVFFEGRTGRIELTYCALMLGLLAGIVLRPAADHAALRDVTMIIYGAAACLLATAAPRRLFSRVWMLVSLATGLGMCVR